MSNHQSTYMNKKWIITEKIIATAITVWGMVTLYSVTSTIYNLIYTGFVSSGNTTYLGILLTNHLNLILSVAGIFGGILLLYGDKPGWLLSIISSAMFMISLFISATNNRNNVKQTDLFFYQSYSVTAITFLVITILLLQKAFREKYKPTAKEWRLMGVILSVLLIDKIML